MCKIAVFGGKRRGGESISRAVEIVGDEPFDYYASVKRHPLPSLRPNIVYIRGHCSRHRHLFNNNYYYLLIIVIIVVIFLPAISAVFRRIFNNVRTANREKKQKPPSSGSISQHLSLDPKSVIITEVAETMFARLVDYLLSRIIMWRRIVVTVTTTKISKLEGIGMVKSRLGTPTFPQKLCSRPSRRPSLPNTCTSWWRERHTYLRTEDRIL